MNEFVQKAKGRLRLTYGFPHPIERKNQRDPRTGITAHTVEQIKLKIHTKQRRMMPSTKNTDALSRPVHLYLDKNEKYKSSRKGDISTITFSQS